MITKNESDTKEYYMIEKNGKFYISKFNLWEESYMHLFDHFRSKEECELFISKEPRLKNIKCNIVRVCEAVTYKYDIERV